MDAKVGDEIKVEVETNKYSMYPIQVKSKCFDVMYTVGHIPREISRHVYFFIKKEGGWITGSVFSVKYRPSPIPSGGLEIPLLLKFCSSKLIIFKKMIQFVKELYDYEFAGEIKDEESEDEKEEIGTVVIEEQEGQQDDGETEEGDKTDDVTKPLVSYLISDEEEEIETIVV